MKKTRLSILLLIVFVCGLFFLITRNNQNEAFRIPSPIKADSIVIEGVIMDYTPEKYANTRISTTLLTEPYVTYPLSEIVDSSGIFRLVIPSYIPQVVVFVIGGEYIETVYEPGDNAQMTITQDTPSKKLQITYAGDNVLLNRELFSFSASMYYDMFSTELMTGESVTDYKARVLQVRDSILQVIDNTCDSLDLSLKTRSYHHAVVEGVAIEKFAFLFFVHPRPNITPSDIYPCAEFDYENPLFLAQYTKALQNPITHDFFHNINDSLDDTDIMEQYVDRMSVSTDRIVKKNPVRDIAFLNALYAVWNVQLLSPKAIEQIDNFVKEPYIKELIHEKNDRLIAAAKRAEGLKLESFPISTEMRDPDSIFTAIVSPHRGKVIYMDIWGVWCAPCREEMEYVPNIKKELAGKDVVFIYLANGTSPEQLRTFIADKDLTGDNVVHYNLPSAQQRAFESKFLDSGHPTYILVDKSGKMATNQAPRPSSGKKLTDDINKLLLAE